MEKYISAYIITFYIYGFAGWIWESLICPIMTRHRIKNSGFLNGPIVPIYGVGALTVSLLFSPTESYLSIFIEGAFVACVIEYLTSWGMEKIYHRRWWDYSDKAFHVNGRVCLQGFLVFGLFSVIAVKYVQPMLLEWIMQYGLITLVVFATMLTTLFGIDFIYTVVSLMHLDERLDALRKDMELTVQTLIENVEQSRHDFEEIMELWKENDHESYRQWVHEKSMMERRIVKAFPMLMKHQGKEEKEDGKK